MSDENPSVPYGYCHCGCGEKTRLAPQSNTREGWTKGEPVRFVSGHHNRLSAREYFVNEQGCWVWQRGVATTGYGERKIDGKVLYAHRWAYELHVGSIPDAHDVHHRCGEKRCVNPKHLVAIAHARHTQIHNRASRCKRGHPFDEQNTYIRPDNGRRVCRACQALRQKKRQRNAL